MIAVVVPVLDEEGGLRATLDHLAADPTPHEVVVVDGGSRDRTIEVATRAGVVVVRAPRGRGVQMNRGAAVTRGEVLLFLHADVRLPPGGLGAVEQALEDPATVGGGFCKRYDGAGAGLAALAWLTNRVRSRALGRFLGTQAMFVRRDVFVVMGGFREWPLFEDVDFSDRLKRAGRRAILDGPVTVSARRYVRRGMARQVALNLLLLAGFRLGARPELLARWYGLVR